MATLSASITQHYPSQQNSLARAHVSATVTYTTSQSNSAVTISASNISVGAISTTGQEAFKSTAKSALKTALSSMTAKLVIYNGATIVSKTGLAPSTSYTVSGSTSINRSTSAQSVALDFYLGNAYGVTNITIPARPSYAVTYNANSGSGAPSTQTKYYGYDLPLSSGRPTKVDHTFLGWATSAARAGTTPPSIDYNPSQTYSGNAALALYAIWKRNYTKPALNNLKVDRCALKDGDYVLDDEGGYAQVTFQWSVFRTEDALYYGGNNKAYANNSITQDGCAITVGGFTVTATPTGQSDTYTTIVGDGTFDTDTAYPVTVSITDTQEVVADNTTIITGELSKAKFPIDINSTATAIGFLTTAPDDDEGVFCPDMTTQEVQDFVDNLEGGGGGGTADRSSEAVTRNDLTEILDKVLSSTVIHRVDATVASTSIAANARGMFRVSNVVPSGVTVLGIIVNATPNNDWFNTMAYMDGRDVIIRYHNEYTGALTGVFNAVVSYAENAVNVVEETSEILEKTVTGTTNAYGAINLSLPWATSEIISVTSSVNTRYCIPFSIGASTYAKVLNDAATFSIVANTSVTLTVRYRTYSM